MTATIAQLTQVLALPDLPAPSTPAPPTDTPKADDKGKGKKGKDKGDKVSAHLHHVQSTQSNCTTFRVHRVTAPCSEYTE